MLNAEEKKKLQAYEAELIEQYSRLTLLDKEAFITGLDPVGKLIISVHEWHCGYEATAKVLVRETINQLIENRVCGIPVIGETR